MNYLAQLCRQVATRRKEPPRIQIDLPDRPNVRDLIVTPHALEGYDRLAEPTPPVLNNTEGSP
jgi:hypothetical protein